MWRTLGKNWNILNFQTLVNPFGILFHPAAIRNFLEKVEQQKMYSEEDIFLHNEFWHSFDAHSDLNTSQKGEILEALNSAVKKVGSFFRNLLMWSSHREQPGVTNLSKLGKL